MLFSFRYGYCYGYGSGYGIKSLNGERVYMIDGVPTIIKGIKGNLSWGYILRDDLSLADTFVAKVDGHFAHGASIKAARQAALDKAFDDMPEDESIDAFVESHPSLDTPYSDLFKWHHILTGSCEQGRLEWCRSHGYIPDDSITVRTFLTQTWNNYGNEIIRRVAKKYPSFRIDL